MKEILWICVSLFTIAAAPSSSLVAQSSETSRRDSSDEHSLFRIGVRYKNDYQYMGRTDSVKAPYISGTVLYEHKTGIFAGAGLSYLTSKEESRIDLFTLSGGYEHYGKRYMFGISLTEYFFSGESYTVQSEMSTQISASVGYNFKVVRIYLDAGVGLSGETDYFIDAEINRIFYFNTGRIRIMPSLLVNAGTQQYYSEYVITRGTQTGNGSGLGSGPGVGGGSSSVTSTGIIESEKFRILDYETGLMVSYNLKKFRFSVTGSWIIPVNAATIVTSQGEVEEDLNAFFLWGAGVRFTL